MGQTAVNMLAQCPHNFFSFLLCWHLTRHVHLNHNPDYHLGHRELKIGIPVTPAWET